MKTLAILFTLFYFINALAVAPYGIKGQQQSATLYSNVHQFPNNQVTNLGGINALVETGNKNILANPSFEHSTFSTSWVNSAGTFSQETSIVIDGKASAKLVLSSQTMSLSQSSTLYQAQFADGVQGLVSVRVKSDVALKVCSIQAGTVSTTNCVDVQANNKWGLYKVPMILGATSNGISIASSGSVSGTVYIDDAFVGVASLTQNINACNSTNCETVFSAKVSSTGAVTSENLDWIDSSCTNANPRVCTFNSVFTESPNCVVVDKQNTDNSNATISAISNTSVSIFTRTTGVITQAHNTEIICHKTGADFTAAKQLSNGNTYSSTNADTDWASCQFSTLAWQGLGTVTNGLECKRQGSDLLMRGVITTGTVSAVQAQVPLPLWNGLQLSTQKNQTAGRLIRGNNSTSTFKDFTAILTAPNNYFTIGAVDFGATSPFNSLNGNALFSSTEFVVFEGIRIPIAGWQQSNIIIGQFNGLESCTNTLECTDTFSAKVSSTGVVSDENIDWINGNGSMSGGVSILTFKTGIFTVAPNCTVVSNDSGGTGKNARTGIPSSSAITMVLEGSGSGLNQAYSIICQKQGADYVGKLAKAVASDQNVRSIGSTGMDLQSVYFGSGANCTSPCTTGTCTVCRQVGSKITSVTWSALGSYRLNGIDGTKYVCTPGNAYNAGVRSGIHALGTSTSTYAQLFYYTTGTTTSDVGYAAVTCTGIP